MKNLTITLALIATSSFALAQQSMTISHAGLQPESEITVAPGEQIEFIYGGGGPHPMTEGWNSGESSTPVPFETVTVTSSSPSAIFTLDTPGTYYFHCGTNPGNSNNWGKINVVDSTSSIQQAAIQLPTFYPNPATDQLTIDGDITNTFITDASGKVVITVNANKVDLGGLRPGIYFLKRNDQVSKFIKK